MARDETTKSNDGGLAPAEIGRLVVAAVLVIVILAFAFVNTESTTVDFVVTEAEAPLIVVLLATAVVGAVIAALLRRRRH
jgi:uncharacterized integral membrane protein